MTTIQPKVARVGPSGISGAGALQETVKQATLLAELTLSAVRAGGPKEVGKFVAMAATFFSEALKNPDLSGVSTGKLHATALRGNNLVVSLYDKLSDLGVGHDDARKAMAAVGAPFGPVSAALRAPERLEKGFTSAGNAVTKLAPSIPQQAMPLQPKADKLEDAVAQVVESARTTGKAAYTLFNGHPLVGLPNEDVKTQQTRIYTAFNAISGEARSPALDDAFAKHLQAGERVVVSRLETEIAKLPAGSAKRLLLEVELRSRDSRFSFMELALETLKPGQVSAFVEALKERGSVPVGTTGFEPLQMSKFDPGYYFHVNDPFSDATAAWDKAWG